jgi:NAD(P)-dependent dehydrogenase (short-subunit alcohol dehydrogenase family)
VAQSFAREGATVVIAEVNGENGARVADEIKHAGGAGVFIKTDVADDVGVAQMVSEVSVTFGRIDILVNNAAVIYAKRLIDHSFAEWQEVMSVVAGGAFSACRAVVPHMIKAGGGRIINVGSISGVVGLREQGAYCAAKGALHQLTRQLAVDHAADGIRVNAICPSAVITPALDRYIDGSSDPETTRAAVLASLPVGRFCKAEEVADAVLFFASEAADYATGAIVMFDGGYTAL